MTDLEAALNEIAILRETLAFVEERLVHPLPKEMEAAMERAVIDYPEQRQKWRAAYSKVF